MTIAILWAGLAFGSALAYDYFVVKWMRAVTFNIPRIAAFWAGVLDFLRLGQVLLVIDELWLAPFVIAGSVVGTYIAVYRASRQVSPIYKSLETP